MPGVGEDYKVRIDLIWPGVGEGDTVRVNFTLPRVGEVYRVKGVFTLPGVGEGDGVRVEVVLSLDDVLCPCERMGVTEELPLVELFGDVVIEVNTADIGGFLKFIQKPMI